jgi:hypothetical protein
MVRSGKVAEATGDEMLSLGSVIGAKVVDKPLIGADDIRRSGSHGPGGDIITDDVGHNLAEGGVGWHRVVSIGFTYSSASLVADT